MSGRSVCHCLKIASTFSLADRRAVAPAQAEARGRRDRRASISDVELFAGFDFAMSAVSMVSAQEARCFDRCPPLQETDPAAFLGNSGEKLHENWTCHGIDHIPLN